MRPPESHHYFPSTILHPAMYTLCFQPSPKPPPPPKIIYQSKTPSPKKQEEGKKKKMYYRYGNGALKNLYSGKQSCASVPVKVLQQKRVRPGHVAVAPGAVERK